MKRITQVTRLQFNKPEVAFGGPLFVILVTTVISALILIAIQRSGADPGSQEYISAARRNASIVWWFPGFLVYFGVQAVSTTFPIAMVLGATRRSFVLGTTLANLIQSAYVAAVLSVLLILEKATQHWGSGIYVFDVLILGDGEPRRFAITIFLAAFMLLNIGGFFGAVWVRFGAKGPVVLGLTLGLAVAILIVVAAPHLRDILGLITARGVAVGTVITALATVAATWAVMRRVSVRC